MQVSRFECLSLGPFPLFWNGFITPEVELGRRNVVQAFMIALVIVVIQEGFDPGFKITWLELVFE